MRLKSGSSRPETQDQRERRLWPRALSRPEPLRLRRTPLLAAALCFALGESLTQLPFHSPPPTAILLAATLAASALTFLALRNSLRISHLPLATLWIAAGLWAAQIQPTPPPQTALLAYADGLSRTVQARVTRIHPLPPRPAEALDPDSPDLMESESSESPEPGTPTLAVDLDLVAIEDLTPDTSRLVPIHGGVRATILATTYATPPIRCGDLVEAPLRLRPPQRFRDPGAWQYADYLLDQRIAATANLPAAKLHPLATQSESTTYAITCRVYAAQTWASERLLAYTHTPANRDLPALARLSPDDAGMLAAMLFGDRTRLTHRLRLGFERTGSFHLFVVSGMHVALLAAAILWISRRVHLPELPATFLTLALTAAYATLTGLGVPVQRALLMTAVFLLARLLARARNVPNALGAAALAVLVQSPRALFEASFQMTFLAIVAIAGIAIPIAERTFLPWARAARDLRGLWRDAAIPPHLAQFRVMLRLFGEPLAALLGRPAFTLPATIIRTALYLAELALIGTVAEAVMVLPMAFYFHRATVFALPANMVSIPLVALLAPLAVLTFLASILSSWLAAIPGAVTALLLHAIFGAIAHVSRSQAADLRLPGPTIAAAVAATAFLAFACWAVRKPRPLAWAAVAALPLAAALSLWPTPPALHPGLLEVTALDVGQGDSLFIAGPTGRTLLVDAGGPTGAAANAENASGTSTFDIGDEVVSPYLWSRHLRRLDAVALTHAHSDHMGGMPAVLRNLRPRELWVGVDSTAPAYQALLADAATLGISVRHLRAGDAIPWDGVDIRVLAPDATYTNRGRPTNNDSLVLHLQFGQASALLEGDAEAASERAMETSGALNPVTLLKVGHHGSRTSTTPGFLAALAPQDAIISVGRRNTFGHPRPEVVTRIAAAHTRLFRTDEFGLTTFVLQRDGRISTLPVTSNP